jgi:hypothetical protein
MRFEEKPFMHRVSRIIAIAATLLLSSTVLSANKVLPPPNLNQAQKLVFFKDHLHGVAKGSELDYGFKSTTKGAESFTDEIKITVTNVVNERKRDLEFNFLSGAHHIDFTPAKNYSGNPVLIHFLERDISQMAKDTGGSNGYFRNRIRDSFRQPSEMRDVKIHYQGEDLNGTEVVVTPFVADPNISNFALYAHKRYEFTFSDQVPGGIYRIHTLVPSDDGKSALIDEEMTFQQITPAIRNARRKLSEVEASHE